MTDIPDGIVKFLDPTSNNERMILWAGPSSDSISMGGKGTNAGIILYPEALAIPPVPFQNADIFLRSGEGGSITLGYRTNAIGIFQPTVRLDGQGNLYLGGSGKDGDLVILPPKATDIIDTKQASIRLNGGAARIELGTDRGSQGFTSPSILLDGAKANIWLGGAKGTPPHPHPGVGGDLIIFPEGTTDNKDRKQATFQFEGDKGTLWLGGKPKEPGTEGIDGEIVIFPSTATDNHDSSQSSIAMDGNKGDISATGDILLRKAGKITVQGSAGDDSIILNGNPGGGNSISIRDKSKNVFACSYTNTSAGIFIGSPPIEGGLKPGTIALRDQAGYDSIFLDGKGSISMNSATGEIKIGQNEQNGVFAPSVYLSSEGYIKIGNSGLGPFVASKSGSVLILNDEGKDSILLDGKKGDINLVNADCAEEFDITETIEDIDPGTVVVMNDDGSLEACRHTYDQRVAGIISGAGDCKPGIVLGRKKTSQSGRAAVSLMGKANCKVDANYSQIKVGDMLTTSKTIGHAMKATDRSKAFGAVIGKALKPLKSGLGLMPILITLQ